MKPHRSKLLSFLALFGLAGYFGVSPARGTVTVTVQPGSQTVGIGFNAVFTAQVSTTAGEVVTAYTWLTSTNGLSPFSTIAGATTATCTLTNVQMTNTGYYFARVTYNAGTNLGLTSVSAAVTLTVPDQARITSHPQGGLIRFAGSNITFSVSAAGTPPLGYQWRLNGTKLANNGRISGVTNTLLSVSALTTNDSGSYDVVVTNLYASVTSQVATLGVFLPPQDSSVILNSNAFLRAVTTGTVPFTYRWQKDGVLLSNGGRISGATSNVLKIATSTTNDEGYYSIAITGANDAVTSAPAWLAVLVPPVFTSPTNALGRQGGYFEFTNTATGTLPIRFGSGALPTGLALDPDSGVISGVPEVMGDFIIPLYATNVARTTTNRLFLTLTTGVPGITSPLEATAKQGLDFTYTIVASNDPVSFSASVLPTGLSLDPVTGIISGAPLVNGEYPITIGASNRFGEDSQVLTLSITSSVPVIISSLFTNAQQGKAFTYTLRTTDPAQLSATDVPAGLHFDPATGVISGPPISSGTFLITLGATNQFGSDSQVLTLFIVSSIPVITSARTATGVENSNFTYTIRANNTPTSYGATNLPLGLTVNPTNGVISGTPWYGGSFTFPIWAANSWGTGKTNLTLNVGYAAIPGLVITNVTATWSKPFLLDFSFSLRDGPDLTNNPVVRPPSQFQVTCLEDWAPISTEAPMIFDSVMGSGSKQLKFFLALDYSISMYVVPGAIDKMEAAAQSLINAEPPHALFAAVEFNADYMDPQIITNALNSTNNYFITDKSVMNASIAGIRTNYVQGNYAGTRCWDAMDMALKNYGPDNPDEQRYLVVMTDGNDDSSLLNSNPDPVGTLVSRAQARKVAIYCVAYGADINTNSLQRLTDGTGGRYYLAATTSDLASQFQRIQKDISGQYVLRWATLKRNPVPAYPKPGFQPAFRISINGNIAEWNTATNYADVTNIDLTVDPPTTNIYQTNVVTYPFNPPDWTNDVRLGSLRLVQDADVGPQSIRLRAFYVPRFVRQIRLNYRPNYPCSPTMENNATNELLYGWGMSETTDTNGLRTLLLTSPDTNNLLTSIKYAALGDLLSFNFTYPDALTTTQAFSTFSVDNTIYTNVIPAGIRFTNQNFTNFITVYPLPPAHGTPIPWLRYYGYTTNYDAAELSDPNGNGMPLWQEYLAGLNPTNAASSFQVSTAFVSGQTPQILFNTVIGRTYRVETATSLGLWQVLRDGIPGTGGNILFIDNRVLSGADNIFYRVSVY